MVGMFQQYCGKPKAESSKDVAEHTKGKNIAIPGMP
jgi:hypothetical protein